MQVDVNGTRLWFDVVGSSLRPVGPRMVPRPTVLLVHGGPGSFDHSYLKPDFDRLAEVAQVVYVDLRGHGRSSWDDPGGWSLEVCADDLHAFCAVLDITAPVVVGHSMGGPIALLHAIRHPGHVAGVAVVAGFGRWDTPRLVEGFRRVAGDEVAAIAGRSYAGHAVSEEEWARVYAWFGPHLPDPGRRARTRRNEAVAVRGMDLVRRVDILDQLGGVTCPVLVMVGDLDPVTPVTASEEIVGAVPDSRARLDVVAGAGHFPWLDAPERVWPMVADFVASQPATGRRAGNPANLESGA